MSTRLAEQAQGCLPLAGQFPVPTEGVWRAVHLSQAEREESMGVSPNEAPTLYARFQPQVYIEQYYAYLGSENRAILRFLVAQARRYPPGARLLDFGCGPTVYQYLAAAPEVAYIDVADYLPANLRVIGDWVAARPGCFDWGPYVQATLELEGVAPVDAAAVEAREREVRAKLRGFFHGDLTADPPVPGASPASYDVVMSNYCLEAIPEADRFEERVANVVALLRPGGRLVVQFTRDMASYPVGAVDFPVLQVTEDDFLRLLPRHGFDVASIEYEVVGAEPGLDRSYASFVMLGATKA